jgi:AcrR family transcriptional regulator
LPKKAAKTPRRKAKQERSRETIEVVLDAAAQVLNREGYARASTNRIAERAGVSVGTIYQYFGDKDQVFAALIDREVAAVVAAFSNAAEDEGGAVEGDLAGTLRNLLALGVRAWRYGPLLYERLEQMPDAALQRRVRKAKARLTEFVRALLERHRRELRVRDLDEATYVVINAAIGLSTNAPPEIYGDRYVEITADLFERYLIADERS